jgi:hypothetical protein
MEDPSIPLKLDIPPGCDLFLSFFQSLVLLHRQIPVAGLRQPLKSLPFRPQLSGTQHRFTFVLQQGRRDPDEFAEGAEESRRTQDVEGSTAAGLRVIDGEVWWRREGDAARWRPDVDGAQIVGIQPARQRGRGKG